MKRLFISHRSTDKKFADILESFFTKCGVPADTIFCSSLPGNDVQEKISSEIKQAIKESLVDVAILSSSFYESAYCQNELGVIWFKDTSIRIIICLPEINEYKMQGFIDSDYKIRRLDNKEDIVSICDTIRPSFPEFTQSTTTLNRFAGQLADEYQRLIKDRVITSKMQDSKQSELEDEIYKGTYSDCELAVIHFAYNCETSVIKDDYLQINSYLESIGLVLRIDDESVRTLVDEDVLEPAKDNYNCYCGYKFKSSIYRQIRRMSEKTFNHIDSRLKKYLKMEYREESTITNNQIDKLIADGLSDEEILLVKYIRECEKTHLFAGWQTDKEMLSIKSWEEINQLDSYLYSRYQKALTKFSMRKFIDASAVTSNDNIKEYKIRDEIYQMIKCINDKSLSKLEATANNYVIKSYTLQSEISDDLPF